ncbi:hypothetical protein Hanom_Chr12g01139081 [Helianthus anomalus]
MLQRGQTAYRGQAFQEYQQHIGNNRLNACQHKWRELTPKLGRFKVCFDRVPTGDLSHDDQMEIAKIEWGTTGIRNLSGFPHFNIYRTL